MYAETMSVSTEFDIFAPRPVQSSIVETRDTDCKPIASVNQSDLEFFIPADHDTYIDPNIHIFIRGKLTKRDGSVLNDKDFTAVKSNFLYPLFSQYSVTLNGMTITQATELYDYRSYLETLLTYGSMPQPRISQTLTGM
jgi:hypothetical protein